MNNKNEVFKSKGGYLNGRQKFIKDFIIGINLFKVSDLAKRFPEIGLNIEYFEKDLQTYEHNKC